MHITICLMDSISALFSDNHTAVRHVCLSVSVVLVLLVESLRRLKREPPITVMMYIYSS